MERMAIYGPSGRNPAAVADRLLNFGNRSGECCVFN